MTAESENLVLEHLRAIRGEMGKMADWMHTMSVEMTAIRQQLASVMTEGRNDERA